MARGKKMNTLYVMQVRLHKGRVNAIHKDINIDVWHKRLRHISEKGLQPLARKQFLLSLQGMPLGTCVNCLVGKTHKIAFHSYP